MADKNYNVDDILAEFSKTKKRGGSEKGEFEGEAAEKPSSSVTEIIEGIKIRKELNGAGKANPNGFPDNGSGGFKVAADILQNNAQHGRIFGFTDGTAENPNKAGNNAPYSNIFETADKNTAENPLLLRSERGNKNAGNNSAVQKKHAVTGKTDPFGIDFPDSQNEIRGSSPTLEVSAEPDETNEVFSALSGDTIGVAGGDLKEIAAKNKINPSEITIEADVKTYRPQTVLTPRNAKFSASTNKFTEEEMAKRSNTALLEAISKLVVEKNNERKDTACGQTAGNTHENFLHTPARGLNIDYRKQVIDKTEANENALHEKLFSPDGKDGEEFYTDGISENEKQRIAGKRKKLREFMKQRDEDDFEREQTEKQKEKEREAEKSDDEDDSADFTRAESVLKEAEKMTRVRFAVMLFLTAATAFVTILNNIGANLAFESGGVEIGFFDRRIDPSGFVVLNIVAGVLAMIACKDVFQRGFSHLFTGESDSDTACAVPALLMIVSAVPETINPYFVQTGNANVYVLCALGLLLFNTLGRMVMIKRVKANRSLVTGDHPKYYADIVDNEHNRRILTKKFKKLASPILCAMRKTELPTNFMKNSYCPDNADRISKITLPCIIALSVATGLLGFFSPLSAAAEKPEMKYNIFWAFTAFSASLALITPFYMMLLVNFPLLRANKSLRTEKAAILGYGAAADFNETSAVLTEAAALFPPGSVAFRNIKACQDNKSVNKLSIDKAIIVAASLAIKCNSILSQMFYKMIDGDESLLYQADDCVYEKNLGITGWIGRKRALLGNREQMARHDIKIIDSRRVQRFCSENENSEAVYLAFDNELAAFFIVELNPNAKIKDALTELENENTAIIVRSKDSLVTEHKIADSFGISAENVKVIPFEAHAAFEASTRYTPEGDGGISCDGTFTSFANALIVSKKTIRIISSSSAVLYAEMFLGAILALLFTFLISTELLNPVNIFVCNGVFSLIIYIIQKLGKI